MRRKIFHFLCRTKGSVLVRGFLYEYFVTSCVFKSRSCQNFADPSMCRTIPFQLSATAYSIFPQLPSILEAVPPTATWGRAMPWWQGPTYYGKNCNNVPNYIKIPSPLFELLASTVDGTVTLIHSPTWRNTHFPRLPRLLSIAEALQLPCSKLQ